ncbi:MAG: T9SS type A sorting domain-containing protein [Bacteroidia bacterium]
MRTLFFLFGCFWLISGRAQLFVGLDTVTVIENGYCLKMPLAGGINAPVLSNMDINFDGKKDILVYDKLNNSALGKFKCFINVGNPGERKYEYDPIHSAKFPSVSNWALVYDYNNDGKGDLFCSITGGIQVFKNIGNTSSGPQFTLVKGLIYSNYNPLGPPSIANVYTSPVGLPAIHDVDNDGDLDILTFSPTGIYIEYHKNMSQELYAHSDSLVYELADQCWGKMSENNCQVNLNQCPSRPLYDSIIKYTNRTLHAGACLMCFDSDGDNDKDLIIGDISCSTVEYCHNGSATPTAVVTDTTKLFPNYPNKNNTTQIFMNAFPCTYYLDLDNDNKNELVAAPNSFGGENINSIWVYNNTSSTGTVNFSFEKKNFLQDEMIDVGQMSRPIIMDVNADGKQDLLIGSYGVYLNGGRKPRLYYYENIGTLTQPSFSLITKDYANLSSVLNGSIISVVPSVGDIDNDGDEDLIIVTNGNRLSWLVNTAGAGNPCDFSQFNYDPFSINFPSSDAIPQLFDFDNDGKLDIMVGTKNGRIYHYQNIGSTSVPSYTLVSGAFPNVSLKGDFFVYGLDGFASPFFYRENNAIKLLGGCVTGQIYYFDVPSVSTNSSTLLDSTANNISEPTFSTPWFKDVNGDGKPELVIGNAGGGIYWYSSKAPEVGISENTFINMLLIYPNPADDFITVEASSNLIAISEIRVYDVSGRLVKSISVNNFKKTFSVEGLEKGIYLIEANFKDQAGTLKQKFVKH